MKVDENCRVKAHEPCGPGYRRLVLEAPQIAAQAQPGQFVHIRVPTLEATALRRPFSIFDANEGILTIVYKTVGRGTAALNKVVVGESVQVMGPLGHGFPTKSEGSAYLVGGGFGVAPLYFLARRLKASGVGRILLFVGARTKDDLIMLEDFEKLGVEMRLATNDGSAGVKGLVTEPLDKELALGEKCELFACGPDPMLKAVAERALASKHPGWISMDRHMICGVGACYACIQRTVRGNSRCCIEGPVFAAKDLVW